MSTLKKPVLELAPPYDDALVRQIEQGFSNMLGTSISFTVQENSSLLCGFVAYIDGVVYDASGKTRLEDIKEYLFDLALVPPETEEKEEFDGDT